MGAVLPVDIGAQPVHVMIPDIGIRVRQSILTIPPLLPCTSPNIHCLWNCKAASFMISYAYQDWMSLCTVLAYLIQHIHGSWYCRTTVFNISYTYQDRISLCTYFEGLTSIRISILVLSLSIFSLVSIWFYISGFSSLISQFLVFNIQYPVQLGPSFLVFCICSASIQSSQYAVGPLPSIRFLSIRFVSTILKLYWSRV